MKRRDFLWTSAGLTGMLLPELGLAQARPCPPGTISATGGTAATTSCGPALGQADWATRSTGPGVVWAHDFTYPEEFTVFDYTSSSISLPSVRSTSRVASGGPNNKPYMQILHPQGGPFLDVTAMQWVSSSVNDGCRVTVGLGGQTLASAGIVAGDYVQFVNMPSDNSWKWFNPHGAGFGSNVYVQVMSIVSSTQFIVTKAEDMQGQTPASFPAFSAPTGCAVHRCRIPSGHWKRPMAAFAAGSNGKPTADPGANGTVTRRTWNPTDPAKHYTLPNAGMYGHASYHSTWTRGLEGRAMTPSDWDGDEWYLQFRVRMPASRFLRGQPAGKLMIVEYLTQTCGGEFVPQSFGKYPTPAYSASWKTASARYNEGTTVPWYAYYGKPYSKALVGTETGYPGDPMLPGGDWAGTCRFNASNGVNDCWWWPTDQWVTILMRFKPGRDGVLTYFDASNGSYPPYPETALEVWAALPGQNYQKVFGRTDFKWSWNQGLEGGVAVDPPGMNSFAFSTYMNLIAGTEAFTHDFAEIIFSKQFVPAPTT